MAVMQRQAGERTGADSRRQIEWMARVRLGLKWAFFPGLNLHARLRYSRLPRQFGAADGEARRVLDAGCGNGMLAYASYLRGADVLGISLKEREVSGCRALFNVHLGISDGRLAFAKSDLYELELERESFDEIICTEVLEHIRDDRLICRKLWQALKPGGVLHLTAPNAEHPYNGSFPLDHDEQGGHVRPGYTPRDWRDLLEPIGFRIAAVEPLGGPVRQFFNRRIKEAQRRFGPAAGLPLFLLALPFLPLESRARERACPFAYT
jgi:2-polyprenyl-3-methyl-5-hydroxy-6-metoxy-1,4-benzoquinol methylase